MTSSTWTFESEHTLHSCGIDADLVGRFDAMAREETPMPLVFTAEEVSHARSCEHPARALCVCFCAKEAVLKALKTPYNLTGCKVFPGAGSGATPIHLDPELARKFGVLTKGRLEYRHFTGIDEVVVTAYLFCKDDHE